jgi:hypothetical protein
VRIQRTQAFEQIFSRANLSFTRFYEKLQVPPPAGAD